MIHKITSIRVISEKIICLNIKMIPYYESNPIVGSKSINTTDYLKPFGLTFV